MKNITKDKITGLAALLFGLSLLWYFIPNWVVMNSAALNHTSPDTFPKFVAIALVLLGAFLLAQAFYREHQNRLAHGGHLLLQTAAICHHEKGTAHKVMHIL